MKNKKHDKIVNDFAKAKSKHLERQATAMLKKDKVNQQLKSKTITKDIFKLF